MAREKFSAITLVHPAERRPHTPVTTFEGRQSVCLQEGFRMSTYNWDLIERLLHEVQNGEGSFAPRKYAEQEAAEKATAGDFNGDLDALKRPQPTMRRCCSSAALSSPVQRIRAAMARTSF